MGILDVFDYFGTVYAKETNDEILLGGIDTSKFLTDVNAIWKNKRVPDNIFKKITNYRLYFDSFFAPDVLYQLEQISELRHRKSHKFRINQAREQLLTQTWLKSTTEPHPDILDFTQLSRLKFKLLPTQLETLQQYNKKVPQMNLKGFLMGTPPGSGKTLMLIALGICLHSDVQIFVVPKNTVTTVWYDGVIEQFGPNTKIWSSVRNEDLTLDYDYYIFHYEALEKAVALAQQLRGIKKIPFIGIDESHNLNEISAQRTLRLLDLVATLDCQHTVFATGTPVKALGLEMIPLLRAIDRYFTPTVEARFAKIYGATAKRANDILRNRLGLISHKIIESDYMNIPPPKEINYPVTIPKPDRFLISSIKDQMRKFMEERYQFYRKKMASYVRIYEEGLSIYERTLKTPAAREEFKLYKERVKKIITNYDPMSDGQIAKFVKMVETQKIIPMLPTTIKNQFKDSLSIVKYAKLRVLGESLGMLTGIRADCASEIARHGNLDKIVLEADKKSIIFSSFIPALVICNQYFIDHGFNTLNVYGDLTKDIANIVKQFKSDPNTNPLLGTLQSLAASQTLTVANVVIFLDSPFREYIRSQAFHRVFRIGQNVQTYIYMCSLDTGNAPNISTRAADILEWSQTQVNDIFGSATRDEITGIVKSLHLNPLTGMDLLLGMIKKINPFS